jgi:hypothetical protein
MTRFGVRALAAAGMATLAIASPAAQGPDASSTFRVFLTDGRAIPSYGESAVLGDRIIFTLVVAGSAGPAELQLMSLPLPSVDLARTQRYASSVRAGHYAATRGEADYAAMTAEVQRALDQILAVEDPKRRLALAEEAKRRLLSWSAEHYYYRASDIRELAGLFDQVIAELRAAAGESQFALDLRAGLAAPVPEPLLPVPGVRDSVALARAAAAAADVVEERVAALRAASSVLSRESGVEDLKSEVDKELGVEMAAEAAYRAMSADVLAKAEVAVRKADVEAVQTLLASLAERDRALGGRRPAQVAMIAAALNAKLEAARIHRLALEHYTLVRRSLLEYERQARPVMSGIDGLGPILTFVRDGKFTAYERLVRAGSRVGTLAADLAALTPPPDLADVHATLVSALHMASEAVSRRRMAATTLSAEIDQQASTAAAGALLLTSHARDQLVVRLFPPKIQ